MHQIPQAAVTVGTGLGGIPGLLFSVPTTSVIYILIKEKIGYRRECEKEEDSSEKDAPNTPSEETAEKKESVPADKTETQTAPEGEGTETV